MAGGDAFVFAVQNPPAGEDSGHPRELGRQTVVVENPFAIVQRYASERPDFGASRGAVDAIPAIYKDPPASLVGGGKGPGLGPLRVVPGGRIGGINGGQTGRTTEHGTA